MLDIQLKIFKTVVDKGGFSAAAQELHMTQSSVSQQIQNLEAYYGMKLFDRMYRKIEVTPAGAVLYPYAMELERLYQETNKAMQSLKGDVSGQLRIGCSMTIGEYFMPDLLVSFSRTHPLVSTSMLVGNSEQISSKVLNGEISLGFIEGRYEKQDLLIDWQFTGDRLVVIAPGDYPVTGQPVAPEELQNTRWVMREKDSGTRIIFEEYLADHGVNPRKLNVALEMGSTQAVKEAVKAGVGIAALSCLTVEKALKHKELVEIPLTTGTIERRFTMLYCRGRFQTRAVEKFIEYIKEHIR